MIETISAMALTSAIAAAINPFWIAPGPHLVCTWSAFFHTWSEFKVALGPHLDRTLGCTGSELKVALGLNTFHENCVSHRRVYVNRRLQLLHVDSNFHYLRSDPLNHKLVPNVRIHLFFRSNRYHDKRFYSCIGSFKIERHLQTKSTTCANSELV